VSKRYTSLLARITRTFDNVNSAADGTGYTLPTADNYLELVNGNIKITTDVTYGILGLLTDNVTIDGLKLTINRNTGAITLADANLGGWTSDSVTFTVTATIGLTTYSTSYSVTKIREGGTGPDITPAPTPTGVVITGGLSYIFIEHDTPAYSVGHGHGKTQVYALKYVENEIPLIENAILQAEFTGTVGSFNSDPVTEWRVWIKWVTNDGYATVNPAGGVNGYSVTTGQNVSKLVEAMTGPGKPFTVVTETTVIDGVTYPAGTYATQSFIADAQITNAKIAEAAIDDAKVGSISAIKLTAGDGTIGGLLKSSGYLQGITGWALTPEGDAEFASSSIRGKITALQIDANGLSIYSQDGNDLILDAGKPLQRQIAPYATNATAGSTLNFDPSCSNTLVWDNAFIARGITGGITGTTALFGSSGEHLLEGVSTGTPYVFAISPQKRYQLSALIRKTDAATTGSVHIGLLEFDEDLVPHYNWGGYLRGKIPVSSLTTNFKKYTVYFDPGSLNPDAVFASVHAIMGYPTTGGGRVEIQDIRVEDITLAYNTQISSVTTAAMNAQVLLNRKIDNDAENIMRSDFFLKTNNYNDTVLPNGTIVPGTGVAIYGGGIIAKKNGVNTFSIGSDGNATFTGSITLDNGEPSRTVITNDKIEIWNQGVRRVILGKLN
jgi:hypothetical protein